jgi:hypothetical protein
MNGSNDKINPFFNNELFLILQKYQEGYMKIINEHNFSKKNRDIYAYGSIINPLIISFMGRMLNEYLVDDINYPDINKIFLPKKSIEYTLTEFANIHHSFEVWEFENLFTTKNRTNIFPKNIFSYRLKGIESDYLSELNFSKNCSYFTKIPKSFFDKKKNEENYSVIDDKNNQDGENKSDKIMGGNGIIIQPIFKLDNNLSNPLIKEIYDKFRLINYKTEDEFNPFIQNIFDFYRIQNIALPENFRQFLISNIGKEFLEYNGQPTRRFANCILRLNDEILEYIKK